MKLAVVGSRTFVDEQLLRDQLDLLDEQRRITEVVSGGARGADTFGARWAIDRGKRLTIHKPNWHRDGKRAGFLRNQLIVNDCDELVAFCPEGEITPGTGNSITLARRASKPVLVIHSSNERLEP